MSLAPELATNHHFALTSPDFRDGEEIPAKYCGPLIGANISPAFAWSALPAGTVTVVLVMEDLDSPGAAPGIHTIAGFAPANDGLPENALAAGAPGISFVPTGRGPGRYVGPRPLPGHGPHRYRFHLYALERSVDFSRISHAEELPAALNGHVLASGVLTGTRES
jgi:hypothetical protein